MKNNFIVLCPPCGENVGLPTKRGLLNKVSFFTTPHRHSVPLPPQGGQLTANGFTLIELLVVVLIIGILAAVALPQYQKAVAKSQATQALTLLNSLQQAYKAYYIANGEWATSLDSLDINIPWTGKTPWRNDLTSTHSTQDWSVQLQRFTNENKIIAVIYVGRLTGAYAGTGFAYFFEDWGTRPDFKAFANTVVCVENDAGVSGVAFTKNVGDFCKKVMGAPKTTQSGTYTRYFNMP